MRSFYTHVVLNSLKTTENDAVLRTVLAATKVVLIDINTV